MAKVITATIGTSRGRDGAEVKTRKNHPFMLYLERQTQGQQDLGFTQEIQTGTQKECDQHFLKRALSPSTDSKT